MENLQDQSLSMLQHQVSSLTPTANRSSTRYARWEAVPPVNRGRESKNNFRLILAVSNLRNISSSTIEKIYFEKTIGTSTPMKKLLCDMFKN